MTTPVRGRRRATAAEPKSLQKGGQVTASVSPPNAADKKAEQRDADLGRGEEEVGIVGQLGDRTSALAPVRQLADLAVAERDQANLGRDENALEHDQSKISRMLRTALSWLDKVKRSVTIGVVVHLRKPSDMLRSGMAGAENLVSGHGNPGLISPWSMRTRMRTPPYDRARSFPESVPVLTDPEAGVRLRAQPDATCPPWSSSAAIPDGPVDHCSHPVDGYQLATPGASWR